MTLDSSPVCALEFTEAQKKEFRAASFWMHILAWLCILSGALISLASFLGLIHGLGGAGIVSIIVGVLTKKAASAFGKVANVPGSEIKVLLEAVVRLKKLYRLQAVLIGIPIVAALVLMGLGIGAALLKS